MCFFCSTRIRKDSLMSYLLWRCMH
jgi:hypothetical protein